MEFIGPSFTRILSELPKRQFTFSSAIRLSMQCLHAIEELHSIGFISRDVKPDNFAVGIPGKLQRLVRMIDFGICSRCHQGNGKASSEKQHTGLIGTSRYCALTSHRHQEQSKRDDLESWFYMSVEMVAGCLPWSHLMAPERELIARMKVLYRTVSPNKFLGKCPEQFDIIIDVIDEWDSKTQPDYDGLFVYLHNIVKERRISLDEPYDWEELPQYRNERMIAGHR
ncbi:unnamed protein product [Toxocara canis]|uniref:Protein kinase domain-containing protein n=1 Tax=Toxocara canis TaxID=6265 RepID=A0A183V927_TOXCA|nr:unnamed protein product [Toxocara canis]